jgi:hypothetical protein
MPQVRHGLDVQVVDHLVVGPHLQARPVHQDAKRVPLSLAPHVHRARRHQREDRAHRLGRRRRVAAVGNGLATRVGGENSVGAVRMAAPQPLPGRVPLQCATARRVFWLPPLRLTMSDHMPLLKRARRRQDRARMVAKALRIFRRADRGHYPPARRQHDYQALADNLAHCGRACCRNPRRTAKGSGRLPWQEMRERQRVDSGVFIAAIASAQGSLACSCYAVPLTAPARS